MGDRFDVRESYIDRLAKDEGFMRALTRRFAITVAAKVCEVLGDGRPHVMRLSTETVFDDKRLQYTRTDSVGVYDVVRCGECSHFIVLEATDGVCLDFCTHFAFFANRDGYCSYGKRLEGGEVER